MTTEEKAPRKRPGVTMNMPDDVLTQLKRVTEELGVSNAKLVEAIVFTDIDTLRGIVEAQKGAFAERKRQRLRDNAQRRAIEKWSQG